MYNRHGDNKNMLGNNADSNNDCCLYGQHLRVRSNELLTRLVRELMENGFKTNNLRRREFERNVVFGS